MKISRPGYNKGRGNLVRIIFHHPTSDKTFIFTPSFDSSSNCQNQIQNEEKNNEAHPINKSQNKHLFQPMHFNFMESNEEVQEKDYSFLLDWKSNNIQDKPFDFIGFNELLFKHFSDFDDL